MCIHVCVQMGPDTQMENKFENWKALQHDKTKTMKRQKCFDGKIGN